MHKIKEKSDILIQAWVALGPILIILSTLAVSWGPYAKPLPFVVSVLVGLFCIFQWEKHGLIASLLLLGVLTIVFLYFHNDTDTRIWTISTFAAMATGLIITALSCSEAQHLFSQHVLSKKNSEKQLIQLEESRKIAEEAWIQHRNELLKKICSIKEEKEALVATLETQQLLIQQLQNSQVTNIDATLIKQEECQDPINPCNYPALYHELRKQFEEKSITLNDTRRQLFHTNEQLLALQKDKEELHLTAGHLSHAALEKHIIRMENTHLRKEKFLLEEIHSLYNFISTLLIPESSLTPNVNRNLASELHESSETDRL